MYVSRWRLQRGHGVTGNGLPAGRVQRMCSGSVSLFGQHRRRGPPGSTTTSSHQSPAVLQRSERGVGQGLWWRTVPVVDRSAAASITPVEPTSSVRTAVSSCRSRRNAHAQPRTTPGSVWPAERRRWVELPRGIRPKSGCSTDTSGWRYEVVVNVGWYEPVSGDRQLASYWRLVPDHAFDSAISGSRVTVWRPPRRTVSWSGCRCGNELHADVVTKRASLRVICGRSSHAGPRSQTIQTVGRWACLLAIVCGYFVYHPCSASVF